MSEKGIFHRDLTQENLLLFEEPELMVKVCDFGCSINLTKTGQESLRGNDRYYAPEADKTYSEKSDIFMFAMILYEFLEGKRIWSDSGKEEVIKMI